MANPIDVSSKKKPPKVAFGKDVAEILRRVPVWIQSAAIAPATLGAGTHQIFTVPPGFMVEEIVVKVTTAFVAVTSATIGDGDDADRFMDSTTFAPATAGHKSSKADAQPGMNYLYSAGDTIDLTLAGTPSAGAAEMWVKGLFEADKLGYS